MFGGLPAIRQFNGTTTLGPMVAGWCFSLGVWGKGSWPTSARGQETGVHQSRGSRSWSAPSGCMKGVKHLAPAFVWLWCMLHRETGVVGTAWRKSVDPVTPDSSCNMQQGQGKTMNEQLATDSCVIVPQDQWQSLVWVLTLDVELLTTQVVACASDKWSRTKMHAHQDWWLHDHVNRTDWFIQRKCRHLQ